MKYKKGIFICCVVDSPIFFVWGLTRCVLGLKCPGYVCPGFDVSGVVNGTIPSYSRLLILEKKRSYFQNCSTELWVSFFAKPISNALESLNGTWPSGFQHFSSAQLDSEINFHIIHTSQILLAILILSMRANYILMTVLKLKALTKILGPHEIRN